MVRSTTTQTPARRTGATRSSRATGRSSRGNRSRSAARSRARPATPTRRSRRSVARFSSRAAPHQREVQGFLDRFTTCLTNGDGDGAVACFELPALMIMSDPKYGPTQVLQEPAKVSEFFAKAPVMYRAKGIETTQAELEGLTWLDEGLGFVTARFPYIDADGNDLGDGERSCYILRRDGNGELAICSAITLGTDSDRQARRRRKPTGDVGDQLT